MIKVKIMLGAAAVRYRQTGKVTSFHWVKKNGGSVFTKDFKNKDELDACAERLRNTFGDEWVIHILSQTTEPEFFAFVWPVDLMPHDVTDRQILEMYNNGPSRSIIDPEDGGPDDEDLYTVERMTPREFTDRINGSDCAFGQSYTRLIYTSITANTALIMGE